MLLNPEIDESGISGIKKDLSNAENVFFLRSSFIIWFNCKAKQCKLLD